MVLSYDMVNHPHVSLLTTAGSFGADERGIRRSTGVEASEPKEGQRAVLRKFVNQRWKRMKYINKVRLRWRHRKPVLIDIGDGGTFIEDEASLTVTFYLSTT